MPAKNTRNKSSKSSGKSTKGSQLPLARAMSFKLYGVAIFALLFVIIGGYLYFSGTLADGNPEIKLAMDNGKYCLDDNGDVSGVKGHPAVVDSWSCNGSPAQAFTKIGSNIRDHGQCLDVYQNGTAAGTRVDLFPCSSPASTNQEWSQGSNGTLVSAEKTHYCLDAPSFQADVQLDIYPCNGGSNQNWSLATFQSGSSSGGLSCTGSVGSPNYGSASKGVCQDAQYVLNGYHWDNQSQLACLSNIYDRESGWDYLAENASGAYGIPQALPGSKMASAGSNWRISALTQIKWGVGYIEGKYGSDYKTPCGAWSYWEGHGNY
jgi:hypothetical protein